ncbi:MAG TPA: hypothetical protein VN750_02220 [Steroidobacteraceae bacterium]|nr:hypothetical protein [Steroidobacteraceae bacterium]
MPPQTTKSTPLRIGFSIEALTLLYLLSYVPYTVLTRWLATVPDTALRRPLSGLEVLPATTLMSGVLTCAFVAANGWWRQAHCVRLGNRLWPRPTRWTALSGIGTALLLVTVPLSFTFHDASIPFMQLLMRGDVLLVAPAVDLLIGRRVRWFSWVALGLVAVGLGSTISARGSLALPPLAIVTVVLYTLGYLIRLLVMSKVAKSGSEQSKQGYFVEEKLVAIPVAILVLGLLSASRFGSQGHDLWFGFVAVWSAHQLPYLGVLSVLLFVISVFSLLILLDRRENTFCVPLERSASVLAGVAAAYLLAAMGIAPPPTHAELTGAALLVAAIVLLSVGPRLQTRGALRTWP